MISVLLATAITASTLVTLCSEFHLRQTEQAFKEWDSARTEVKAISAQLQAECKKNDSRGCSRRDG